MRFAYLLLADAVNQSADGKLNILGAGIRTINAPALPFSISLAIIAAVELDLAERGPKKIQLAIRRPDGEEVLIDDVAEMDVTEPAEEDLPISLNLQFGIAGFELRSAGVHTIVVRVDALAHEYVFLVKAPPPAA